MRDIQNRKEKQYNIYTTGMTNHEKIRNDIWNGHGHGYGTGTGARNQDLDHGVQFSFKAYSYFFPSCYLLLI
jgi:hypothetical protein